VHYGLVPRTNRGVFAINELPDLAERIQVSLLNVLEERDIQVRGYLLRLPLDLLLVASANPRTTPTAGGIITPLKDRFGSEIRTHYPLRLEDELACSCRSRPCRPRCRCTCSRSWVASPGSYATRPRWTGVPGCRRGSA
jgi:Mg-chelatase subunit ChlI